MVISLALRLSIDDRVVQNMHSATPWRAQIQNPTDEEMKGFGSRGQTWWDSQSYKWMYVPEGPVECTSNWCQRGFLLINPGPCRPWCGCPPINPQRGGGSSFWPPTPWVEPFFKKKKKKNWRQPQPMRSPYYSIHANLLLAFSQKALKKIIGCLQSRTCFLKQQKKPVLANHGFKNF